MLDHDAHARILGRPTLEPKARAHVDGRDDAAAQIERPGHLGRRQRNAGDALRSEHVVHDQHRNAEHLVGDRDRDILALVVDLLAEPAPGRGDEFAHAWALWAWARISWRICSSASRSNLAI